jgi:hypothetical protein
MESLPQGWRRFGEQVNYGRGYAGCLLVELAGRHFGEYFDER